MLFALCRPVEAEQPAKIPKIGALVFRSRSGLGTGREMFRRSLRELSYVDGKSISYETPSADGKLERFPVLAEELVPIKVGPGRPRAQLTAHGAENRARKL